MRIQRASLLGALALLGTITFGASAQAQVAFDEIGIVSDNFGSGCTTFIDNATGQQWLPDVPFTGFNVGDTVRVTGTTDPNCFSFCFSLAACITGATITSPAPAFDACGIVSDNFGSACTTFVDNATGLQWLPDVSLAGFNIGDQIRITGTPDTGCFNFCFSLNGCINGAVISMCAPNDPYTPFCFGNGGTSNGCTDCPCGNNAPAAAMGGCLNSAGTSAELVASGTPDVGSDSMRFEVTGATLMTFGILQSADNQLPAMGPCAVGSGITSPVLDALRCVGGNALRHGTRMTDANGDIGVTTAGWGPPNGPAGGIIASSGFASGQTRNFQCFYREDMMLGCGTGQNTTNGVSVTFGP